MPGLNPQHHSRSTTTTTTTTTTTIKTSRTISNNKRRRDSHYTSNSPTFFCPSLQTQSQRNSSSDITLNFSSSDPDSFFLSLAACPDPDPDPSSNNPIASFNFKVAAHKVVIFCLLTKLGEVEEEIDPFKHSFSEALKECQTRRLRSEPHHLVKRKHRNHRPSSLDAATVSPRFLNAMKKTSVTATATATSSYPSPGTPTYQQRKGWSSERVVAPGANLSRRGMASVLPFNNGRAIPSKWEDAEKWIFSPSGSENAGRNSMPLPHHRRPKSKSGPLGPPAYLLSSSLAASPLNPCFDSGRVGEFHGSSPFLAGVGGNVEGGGSGGGGVGGEGGGGGSVSGGRSSSVNAEPYILRSASIHGWSDTMMESCSSVHSSLDTVVQDEKIEGTRGGVSTMLPSAILRKDVATQMSPDGSAQSSPKERRSFSQPSSAHPIEELEKQFLKLEVRDVQVDDRVTVTRWSKKHMARGSDKRSINMMEWKKKTVEAKGDTSSDWGVAESTKSLSKYTRDEAKITAWENLQKAKAEEAIRKLEMKLEKKRSSSMDKILNKLRAAQRKAQDMRVAVSVHSQQFLNTTTPKRESYFRRTGQIGSIRSWFTCPAF